MTKAIRSFPEAEQFGVAKRRVAQKTGGLGYISAENFLKRSGKVVKVVVKEEVVEEADSTTEVE